MTKTFLNFASNFYIVLLVLFHQIFSKDVIISSLTAIASPIQFYKCSFSIHSVIQQMFSEGPVLSARVR